MHVKPTCAAAPAAADISDRSCSTRSACCAASASRSAACHLPGSVGSSRCTSSQTQQGLIAARCQPADATCTGRLRLPLRYTIPLSTQRPGAPAQHQHDDMMLQSKPHQHIHTIANALTHLSNAAVSRSSASYFCSAAASAACLRLYSASSRSTAAAFSRTCADISMHVHDHKPLAVPLPGASQSRKVCARNRTEPQVPASCCLAVAAVGDTHSAASHAACPCCNFVARQAQQAYAAPPVVSCCPACESI